jgi:hypothetical protein
MRPVRVWICALAIAAVAAPTAGSAAVQPTLSVVVLGGGSVTSKPAGISCPGKCAATFPAGTSVLLTPKPKSGAPFLRWGGSCSGAGPCRVRVSSLSAVAAQFAPRRTTGKPPTLSKSAAEPGTYSLYNSYRTFFVAPGGRSVLNVAVGGVPIACTPAASAAPTSDYLVIPRVGIRPNGSFVGKGSQKGIFAGVPATFTYSFSGRFTPATAGKQAGATGSFREDIVFKDNVTHRCTSNTQSWTAVKTGPIPQPTSLLRPGKYSLYNSYRTFSVAPGGRSIVNIAIGGVSIACTPAGKSVPTSDQIVIAQAAIKPDGTFAATAMQSGVFAGAPAKFTFTFTGAFQGPSSNGATTAAGLLREDIVFSDSGGTHTCTSNTQPWIAVE